MTASVTSRASLDARDDAEEATSANNASVVENNNLFGEAEAEERLSLSSFLIERACGNMVVGNYLYLLIECEDRPAQDTLVRAMYLDVMRTFSHQLAKA